MYRRHRSTTRSSRCRIEDAGGQLAWFVLGSCADLISSHFPWLGLGGRWCLVSSTASARLRYGGLGPAYLLGLHAMHAISLRDPLTTLPPSTRKTTPIADSINLAPVH
jgi:hypothetical protein